MSTVVDNPTHIQGVAEALRDPARLCTAFGTVAKAGGAPGVDGVTVGAFGEDMLERVDALAAQLADGTYEPSPLLAVRMPKDRDPRGRELLIPCVADRVLQRAVHDILGPEVDARLLPCVYGFWPSRSVQRAVTACRAAVRDRPWVADADIRDFFATVPFANVLQGLGAWVHDYALLSLVEKWIAAPALRAGRVERRDSGLPLGSPLSPLLSNVVLHALDAAMLRPDTTYLRFADDLVVCCAEEAVARARLEACRVVLADLGLDLNAGKSRVIDARRESMVFLGHLVRSDADCADAGFERPHRRTLHVVEPGSQLSVRAGRFVIQRDGVELLSVPVRRVRDIVVLAPIAVTSPAMTACLQHGIDVAWLSDRGRAWGALRTWKSPAPELRRVQAAVTLDDRRCLQLAKVLVAAKIHNQRRLLQRQRARGVGTVLDEALTAMARASAGIADARDRAALMGAEGVAARAYFGGLGHCVEPSLGFSGRVRRPPTDPVNALLSFGYVLLTNEVATAVWRTGLDADLGIAHQPRTGRPSLALDLVEELRTLVDALVLSVLRRRVLRAEHFLHQPAGGGVRISDDGRRSFLHEYELRLLTLFSHAASGERVSYRRALTLQAELFARVLRDPGIEYLPILTS